MGYFIRWDHFTQHCIAVVNAISQLASWLADQSVSLLVSQSVSQSINHSKLSACYLESPFRLFFSHSISLSVCWSIRQIGGPSVREFSQSASQGVQSSIQLGSQSVDAVSQSVSQGFRQSVSYSVGQSAGQGIRQQTGRETFSQLVS